MDDQTALFATTVLVTLRNIFKTLSIIASGTFFGKIPPFVVAITADKKPVSVPVDAKFLVVKFFIQIVAEQCNMEGVVDVGAMQRKIESRLNFSDTGTKESWQAFRDSSQQKRTHSAIILHHDDNVSSENTSSSSTTSATAVVVTPTVKTLNLVWTFLGGIECPVAKRTENGKVVMKDFTSLNIREDVTLVLQLAYTETRRIGDLFHVTRFSTEEGILVVGKYLNGRFDGERDTTKVSHLNFVIQDEESPPIN